MVQFQISVLTRVQNSGENRRDSSTLTFKISSILAGMSTSTHTTKWLRLGFKTHLTGTVASREINKAPFSPRREGLGMRGKQAIVL
jgi:hypothetical protein